MTIELTFEDDRWQDLEPLAERAVAATLANCGLDASTCEVSILACDDARIADLNTAFRGKSTPTNVLSWPAADLAAPKPGGQPAQPEPDYTGDMVLGDIAISYDTCAREATEAGKRFEDHVTHLLVHGLLHLLGYDHVRDADAGLMEALEIDILCKLGIANPYVE